MSTNNDLEQGLLAAAATPTATTIPIEVRMENVDYFVNNGKKQIIHDVSLRFRPGRLACLMGPSGSGKTTCLNLILGNASGEVKHGQILVNGQPGPPRSFKSVAKLIPQEDVLLPSFSVRETLDYHAQLVLPQNTPKEERLLRVDEVIQSLGLTVCADTRIGNVEERGISGGQRKRVSISMELLSNPCVLCVDEPTSGLDSSSAEDVISLLKDLCTSSSSSQQPRTVICTIHQPSFRIFSLFDDVNMLTKGRVAYAGPMMQIESFFQSIGEHVPAKENPCDHFMRLLQDEVLADTIPVEFARKRAEEKLGDSNGLENDESLLLQGFDSLPSYPTSTWHQVMVLFRRQSFDYSRDANKLIRMLAAKAGVGLLVGAVWYQKANPPRQSELTAIQGALFLLAFSGTLDSLGQTLLTFPLMRSLFRREYKNGSYSVLSFYVANIVCLAVFGFVCSLAQILPVYLMVGFELTAEKFGVFLLTSFISTLIGNALGLSIGAASKDIMEAQNMLVPLIAPLTLFSGFLIPKAQIPGWAMIFYKLSFFQYNADAIAIFELNCFTGMVFEDYNMDIFHPSKIRPFKTGEQWLKALDLDPATHFVSHYMQILAAYAAIATILGYFIVKWSVSYKTD